ncbi:MAG: hypothetical protein HeimC3_37050 [Candidatus Heimdallarchaeota archaeon LC_3]|nr:MAG: hypothetical protein HeimC3_37050 [Candidatus Heimdallarchaeota archaeon LC_3]
MVFRNRKEKKVSQKSKEKKQKPKFESKFDKQFSFRSKTLGNADWKTGFFGKESEDFIIKNAHSDFLPSTIADEDENPLNDREFQANYYELWYPKSKRKFFTFLVKKVVTI